MKVAKPFSFPKNPKNPKGLHTKLVKNLQFVFYNKNQKIFGKYKALPGLTVMSISQISLEFS